MNLLPDIVEKLKARDPLPPLYPTQIWDANLSAQIRESTQLNDAVRAGLLLWNDDLEASHEISQNIHDATGSYWHAIMHRREGDLSNAEYWCHRIGVHPAFDSVQQAVLKVLEDENEVGASGVKSRLRMTGTWTPDHFVYDCLRTNRGSDTAHWILKAQVAEIETLLNWCLE